MLLEDAGTSLNKMPKAPLREDLRDAFPTFQIGIPSQRILPLFYSMASMASIRDLEIDSLPSASNDSDWEGVMLKIQKVERDQKKS